MKRTRNNSKTQYVTSTSSLDALGRLIFNPLIERVTSPKSIHLKGVISTFLYLENGIQQVGITTEVIDFNKAVEFKSCTNPKRVLNEYSFKNWESTKNKFTKAFNVKNMVKENMIEMLITETCDKVVLFQKDNITTNNKVKI